MQQKQKRLSQVIWTEKYRPRKLEHLIVPNRIRKRFENGLDANILLSGTAGLGKTTLAKILAADRSVLFINASIERGIDIIRNKVTDFAATASLVSATKKKVVILDEACNLSKDAQQSLKATIETYSKNAYFIFTANHPEKLIDPLKSRLEDIKFNFDTEDEKLEQFKQYMQRIKMILNQEGRFTIAKEARNHLLKSMYPDLRRIINILFQVTRGKEQGYEIQLDDLTKVSIGANVDFFDFIIKEHRPSKIYEYVKGKFGGKELNTLNALGSDFLGYLNKNGHANKTLAVAVISHKYIYEATTGSIDPLIPLLACCSAISDTFKTQT